MKGNSPRMSDIEELIKIENQINELKKRKMELLVKKGEAYKCRKCGAIMVEYALTRDAKPLCYRCWTEKVMEEKQKKLTNLFSKARIVKIVKIKPHDNPYFDFFKVAEIVLEVDSKYYVIKAGDGWNSFIEISEVPTQHE
jgi:hypothetical protein